MTGCSLPAKLALNTISRPHMGAGSPASPRPNRLCPRALGRETHGRYTHYQRAGVSFLRVSFCRLRQLQRRFQQSRHQIKMAKHFSETLAASGSLRWSDANWEKFFLHWIGLLDIAGYSK